MMFSLIRLAALLGVQAGGMFQKVDPLTCLLKDMIDFNMFASREFSAREIAHRELSVDPDHAFLFEAAHYQLGHMQSIRDFLCHHFKKDVPIAITSGFRPIAFNKTIGGVDNSLHIWRLGVPNRHGLQLITACDFRPLGVDIRKAFEALAWCKGEMYLHVPKSIIHYSPYGNEPHFIKET